MRRSYEPHGKHVTFSEGGSYPINGSSHVPISQVDWSSHGSGQSNRDKYRPGLFGRVEHDEWYAKKAALDDKAALENKNEKVALENKDEEDINSVTRDFIKRTNLKYDFRSLSIIKI